MVCLIQSGQHGVESSLIIYLYDGRGPRSQSNILLMVRPAVCKHVL